MFLFRLVIPPSVPGCPASALDLGGINSVDVITTGLSYQNSSRHPPPSFEIPTSHSLTSSTTLDFSPDTAHKLLYNLFLVIVFVQLLLYANQSLQLIGTSLGLSEQRAICQRLAQRLALWQSTSRYRRRSG